MLTLLKDIECYCPQYIGKRDIFIATDKIYKIVKPGQITDYSLIAKIVPCEGLIAFPGLIDQHVHIIGGGGENGFQSRLPELDIKDVFMSGVTTLVGVLGLDSYTKSLADLLAKARGLESQGVTTFIYTGSYAVPPISLTDNITNDLVLIDKIIGTGEIAISDHRSTYPDQNTLIELISQTHIGGLLSGKAGIVHIHVGDGKNGIAPLLEVINNTDFLLENFVPTHLNRNPQLFKEASEYCLSGGNIDLTAGETIGIPVPDAVETLISIGADLKRVTVSSDGNSSNPDTGILKMQNLLNDIRNCITVKNINPEIAFSMVTENVARILKIYPQKGVLKEGSDADILITDKNYSIQMLLCKGNIKVNNRNGDMS